MSADSVIKNDMLMRQSSDLGVEENLLRDNSKANSNKNNSTASLITMDDSYVGVISFVCISLLVVTLLFRFKNPLQFYVKYTVYVCITMIYSMCCIPFTLLRPNNARNIEWVENFNRIPKSLGKNVTLFFIFQS